MNLTDPVELKGLLERHGFRPQKRWGQHFLIAPSVVEAILARTEGFRGALEVGPGPGVLTAGLCERLEKVIALEVDPIAVSALTETAPKADVRSVDALCVDLRAVLIELPAPRVLVSNMPYNITGPLLTSIAGVRTAFDRAVLMMQKEVGERVVAPSGSSECGSLSVFLQTQFHVTRVCRASKSAFFPPPKVDSVVLQFEPRETGLDQTMENALFRHIRLAFAQPRKTLANNICVGLGSERVQVASAIKELGLASSVRPHEVPLDTWKALSAILSRDGLRKTEG